jgi:hypothetical protein
MADSLKFGELVRCVKKRFVISHLPFTIFHFSKLIRPANRKAEVKIATIHVIWKMANDK